MHTDIGECGSTLYVGLSGRYSSEPNTKVYGMWPHPFKHFLGMSRATDSTKDAMKKQIWRIHSFFSHVRP